MSSGRVLHLSPECLVFLVISFMGEIVVNAEQRSTNSAVMQLFLFSRLLTGTLLR